jgi:branched-chain amino acid transport system substrate-binding protein
VSFRKSWHLGLLSISFLGIFACSSGGSIRRNESKESAKAQDLENTPPPSAAQQRPQIAYRSAQDPNTARSNYMEAKRLFFDGKRIEGSKRLIDYAQSNPNGQYVDEAYLIVANEALEGQRWSEADEYASKVLDLNPPSRLRGQAWIVKAKVLHTGGRGDEALRSLLNVRLEELPQREHLALFSLWGQLAEEQSNYRDAVLAYVKASRQPELSGDQIQNLHEKVAELVATKVSEKDASLIVREYGNRGFPGNVAALRMAKLLMARGEKGDAELYLNQVLAFEPRDSVYAREAMNLKNNLDNYSDDAEYKVGILFPVAGKYAAWSQRAREGLELAWQRSNGLPGLIVEDAGSSLDSFRKAFEKLVLQDKVIAIIGPTIAEQAELGASLSQQYGVPYFSLSPRSGLLEKSPYLYRFALSAEAQAQAVVNYAWNRLNARRFAILFPEDNFGNSFAKPFIDAVRNRGGTISAAESYNPNESDFLDPVRNMVGTGFSVFRSSEFQEEVKLHEERTGKKLTNRERAKIKLRPIVDFDVLFIPDTFKAVGQIIPTLLFEDIKDVKLFGPSSWNNKQLLERAGQYMENAFCVDVSLADKSEKVTQDFISQYKLRYGRSPTDISALTYDLGLSLSRVFRESKNLRSRSELRSSLESLGEVQGAIGKHRWDAERDPLGTLQLFQARKAHFQYIGDISLTDFN